jgi:rhamnosyltransferase
VTQTAVRATVVVRARNEAAAIARTLDAVLAQDVPVDLLVIDSGSTDGTLDIVRARPQVRLHQMPARDFTFGRACNLGLELTATPFVAFLSAHAWPVDRTWSERMLSPFDEADVAGVYGRQDPVPGQDPVRADGQRRAFAIDGEGRTQAHFSNANSAVRRSAWESVPFDETLSGSEDFVWAGRQQELGNRVVYVYDAAVYHSHNESLPRVYRRHRIEAAGLLAQAGPPRARDYVRDWVQWSRDESRRLIRSRDARWAAWAPLYFAARLSGDYLGRRAALRRIGRD